MEITLFKCVKRAAVSSSFGIYSFDSAITGENYTMTVGSKRYRYTPQILFIQGTLTNVDFIGLE